MAKPNLKLFTGETPTSFIEELVDNFIHDVIKKDDGLESTESILLQTYLDSFINYCTEQASDKIVLDNGKMTPFAISER